LLGGKGFLIHKKSALLECAEGGEGELPPLTCLIDPRQLNGRGRDDRVFEGRKGKGEPYLSLKEKTR